MEKFTNFLNEIKWSILKYTGIDFLKHNLFLPLERTLSWAPVLWFNYDFDSGYMITLLAEKLKRLRKALVQGYGVVIDPKDPEYNDPTMKKQRENYFLLVRAYHLARRISKNNYWEDYQKMFARHYGGTLDFHLEDTPPYENGLCEMKWKKDSGKIRPDKLEIACKVDERYNGAKYSEYHINKDADELFDIIKKNWRCWWD